MAWNGSGVFNRLYNWVTDRDASVKITASRMDGEADDFAAGIQNCITKDGQNSATANLPMGNFRHTGVGNAAARTDYTAAGQVQDNSLRYAAATGATNTYAITLAPAITAYAEGQEFTFKANAANTGTCTLNVNSVGAVTLKKDVTTNLAASDIAADQMVKVVYDGTNFQVISRL